MNYLFHAHLVPWKIFCDPSQNFETFFQYLSLDACVRSKKNRILNLTTDLLTQSIRTWIVSIIWQQKQCYISIKQVYKCLFFKHRQSFVYLKKFWRSLFIIYLWTMTMGYPEVLAGASSVSQKLKIFSKKVSKLGASCTVFCSICCYLRDWKRAHVSVVH